jgi:hypothetical protein
MVFRTRTGMRGEKKKNCFQIFHSKQKPVIEGRKEEREYNFIRFHPLLLCFFFFYISSNLHSVINIRVYSVYSIYRHTDIQTFKKKKGKTWIDGI